MSQRSRSSSPSHLGGQELPVYEEIKDTSSTRRISLVERIEVSVPTSRISPNAIVLGNIDNDPANDIELAIGNGEGDVFIFKGKKKYAWKRATGLGSISCLALGDLLNRGQNSLVVISTEGSCYLLDTSHQPTSNLLPSRSFKDEKHEKNDSTMKPPSLGTLSRKYPSNELKYGSQQLQPITTDETRIVHPEPQHVNESGSIVASRSAGNWSANRSDSAPPGALGKHPETATIATTAAIGQQKPIVHDDWVSNAPTSSVQPNSSILASMAASGATSITAGVPTTTSTSAQSNFASATGHPFGSAEFGDVSRNMRREASTGLLDLSGPGPHLESSLPPSGSLGSGSASVGSTPGPSSGVHGTQRGAAGAGSANVKTEKIEPLYRWFVTGNATCALVADVDEDGQCELILGTSNRVVYSYGIIHEIVEPLASTSAVPSVPSSVTLKLKLKNKWNVSGQVGSLSLSHDKWGRPILIVSQHGGNYTTIDHRGNTKFRQVGNPDPVSHLSAKQERNSASQIRHLFRSPFSSTGASQDPVLMAMVGLDGSVKLQQDEHSKFMWQKQFDRQFFALSILDLTGDGNDEIIACAWDGMTYIFDQIGNCVEFQFDERVAAFAAGQYSVTRGTQQPCLFFLTFSDHLYIYHNISIPSIPIKSLIGAIGSGNFEANRNTKIDKGGPWTRSEQARLLQSLLDPTKFDETAAMAYKQLLEQRLQELSQASS